MSEDKKDFSFNLNADFNKQDIQISETAGDKDKIYNPPDINKIKEEKENIENIDEKEKGKIYFPPDIDKVKKNLENIDEKLKDEEFMTTLKRMFNDTGMMEYFIDKTEKVSKDKEKIMNSLAELKKRRINEDIVTKEEILLFEYILYHFKEQELMKCKQKLKEKKEINDVNDNTILDEEVKKDKKIEACVNKLAEILKNEKFNVISNKDIFGKENEDFLNNFNNSDNNIIFPNELIQDKKSRSNESNIFHCLGDCFSAIYNFCFKIGDRNDYKGLIYTDASYIILLKIFYFLVRSWMI